MFILYIFDVDHLRLYASVSFVIKIIDKKHISTVKLSSFLIQFKIFNRSNVYFFGNDFEMFLPYFLPYYKRYIFNL